MPADKSSGFVSELRRRNVFRVAIAYLAVAWLVIQVAETILPVYGFGDIAIRTIITLFAVLFVPVLVLAWFFELTPEGIVAEADADHTSAQALGRGRKFDFAIIGILSVALLYFVSMYDWRGAEVSPTAGPPDKSVAVLPFVNVSGADDDEYFSDGLTETLLNALAQIPDIKVPARTSSFFFKGQDIDIREIARTLDVGNVLMGAIQRQGNKVRITVQLSEAATGFNLWSETYDREIDDIFVVQDEIANRVADELQVTLLGAGGKIIQVAGTDSVPAYEAYLKGVEHLRTIGIPSTQTAIIYLREAVGHDPEFLDARIKLADAYLQQVALGDADRQVAVARAREQAEVILDSNPDHKPAQYLLARLNRVHDENIEQVSALIDGILHENPDQVDYYYQAYFLFRHVGRPEDGFPYLERGLAIDPLSARLHYAYGVHMLSINQLSEAEKFFLKSIELNPDDPTAYGYASQLYWQTREYAKWFAIRRDGMNVEAVDVEIPINVGLNFLTFGLDNEAQVYFARAESIEPGHAYLDAARLYRMVVSGEHDDARAYSKSLVQERVEDRRGTLSFAVMIHLWLMHDTGKLEEAIATIDELLPEVSSSDFQPRNGTEAAIRLNVVAVSIVAGRTDLGIEQLESAANALEARYPSWEGLPGIWALVRYLGGDVPQAVELALEDLDGRQGWLQAWDWPLRYHIIEPYKKLAEKPAVAERLAELEAEARQAGAEIRAYIEAHNLQLSETSEPQQKQN